MWLVVSCGNGTTVIIPVLYGMGVKALAENLGMTETAASQLKSDYFAALPTAGPFVQNVQRVTRQRGYIRNLYGRRRRLTPNECFKACNALIQGCAADYLKHKSVLIYKFLKMNNYKSHLVLWVHDEILIQVAHGEEHILPIVRWLMSDFTNFRTYITAGIEKCDGSWGKKIDVADEIGFQELSVDELEVIKNYDIYAN